MNQPGLGKQQDYANPEHVVYNNYSFQMFFLYTRIQEADAGLRGGSQDGGGDI